MLIPRQEILCLPTAGGEEQADGCSDERCGEEDRAPLSQAGVAELDAGFDHAKAGNGPEPERDGDRRGRR